MRNSLNYYYNLQFLCDQYMLLATISLAKQSTLCPMFYWYALNRLYIPPRKKYDQSRNFSQSITGLFCNLPVMGIVGVMVDVEVEGTAKR